VAAELPGIGWERAGAIALAFPTLRRIVAATEAEWLEVDGIGKKLAKQLVEVMG
jgi:excinuclease UvrABC nuclease subunit